ncbi:hypothetical protein B0H14DRAFT_2592439 [Mycena olivaceomarginata]|nr:hypothetical protein B0H14DRAFT_2592439 [Mycena olivaceomarginata]
MARVTTSFSECVFGYACAYDHVNGGEKISMVSIVYTLSEDKDEEMEGMWIGHERGKGGRVNEHTVGNDERMIWLKEKGKCEKWNDPTNKCSVPFLTTRLENDDNERTTTCCRHSCFPAPRLLAACSPLARRLLARPSLARPSPSPPAAMESHVGFFQLETTSSGSASGSPLSPASPASSNFSASPSTSGLSTTSPFRVFAAPGSFDAFVLSPVSDPVNDWFNFRQIMRSPLLQTEEGLPPPMCQADGFY